MSNGTTARPTDTMEATFAFVDLAGYTALTEAHGAAAAADCIERFAAWTQEALSPDGRLIERVGDAVFVMLATPIAGVRFVRHLFAAAVDAPDFPVLRGGLHHGEALERNRSFFGATINVAARVAAQARGGQILVTAVVAAAARAEGFAVSSLGSVSLRNVRDPVELFDLQVLPAVGGRDAIDPVCRMRVARERAAGQLRFNGVDYWFCSMSCVAQFSANPEVFARNAGPT